ncbi:Transcription factor GAMYB [Apostasia shenzhenica]|uniref:Transcription factor GAMYB n=1 Tax=Apostasia shenzhenica TaxID=1088818 RepID=A0A2H9ZWS7_9ASPA|nr:Transcription factor GAMYB [Apostasia shenzhenica]
MDQVLLEYLAKNNTKNWVTIAKNSGLQRDSRSCRFRWVTHLDPHLKKEPISPDEETMIIRFHAMFGNKWSMISRYLPGRTDNEIKNYWNTRIKRCKKSAQPLYPPDIQCRVLNQSNRSPLAPLVPPAGEVLLIALHQIQSVLPLTSSSDVSTHLPPFLSLPLNDNMDFQVNHNNNDQFQFCNWSEFDSLQLPPLDLLSPDPHHSKSAFANSQEQGIYEEETLDAQLLNWQRSYAYVVEDLLAIDSPIQTNNSFGYFPKNQVNKEILPTNQKTMTMITREVEQGKIPGSPDQLELLSLSPLDPFAIFLG